MSEFDDDYERDDGATLDDVVNAIEGVRADINSQSIAIGIMILPLVIVGLSFLLSDIQHAWHSKWRYGLSYSVSSDMVFITSEPHDCDFLKAPLGMKYCHYDRVVTTLRWGRSPSGVPLQSTDEGKTWHEFTPKPEDAVPQNDTLVAVYVNWEKKDE